MINWMPSSSIFLLSHAQTQFYCLFIGETMVSISLWLQFSVWGSYSGSVRRNRIGRRHRCAPPWIDWRASKSTRVVRLTWPFCPRWRQARAWAPTTLQRRQRFVRRKSQSQSDSTSDLSTAIVKHKSRHPSSAIIFLHSNFQSKNRDAISMFFSRFLHHLYNSSWRARARERERLYKSTTRFLTGAPWSPDLLFLKCRDTGLVCFWFLLKAFHDSVLASNKSVMASLQGKRVMVTCRATRWASQISWRWGYFVTIARLGSIGKSRSSLLLGLRVTRSPITLSSLAPIGAGSVVSRNRVTAKFSTIFFIWEEEREDGFCFGKSTAPV